MTKAAENDAEKEAEILAPDAEIEIGGEKVMVRELRFGETLSLAPQLTPIVKSLHDAMDVAGDDLVDFEMLSDVFAIHGEALVTVMAVAVDRDEAWVRDLDSSDGLHLISTFWKANRDFFKQRLVALTVARRVRAAAQMSAGEKSSPSSPETDMSPAA